MRVVLLACLLFACKSKSDKSEHKPPVPPLAGSAGSAASGSAADPWTVEKTKPETPEDRKKRAQAALARVGALEEKVAEVRGLKLKQHVETEYQELEAFKKAAHAETLKGLPPDVAPKLSAAYAHIGLLEKDVDLIAIAENAFVSQAAAYYDPAVNKFFLVAVPQSDDMIDVITVHELVHAVTDQYFNLDAYAPAEFSKKLDDDVDIARHFIGEGDATLAMMLFSMGSMKGMLRGQIEQGAKQDLSDIVEQSKSQAKLMAQSSPDFQRSADAIGDIPPVVAARLMYSYTKGALVALEAYERGGWEAVNELYRKPPESSEQVLHPATKLYPKRELPVKVTLPKIEGEPLYTDTLGELQWWVYFYLWNKDAAAVASEGWGGDRYTVVKTKDGVIGLIASTWDTVEDAKQVHDAYVASLTKRFASDPKRAEHVFVKLDGKKLFIADGAPDKSWVERLSRETKFL